VGCSFLTAAYCRISGVDGSVIRFSGLGADYNKALSSLFVTVAHSLK
jgi:hypothetical protein